MKKIWDWYYGKASIRKKLIISYLILVILPILVLGMYSYYVSKKNLIRQTKHTMESNVDAISYSLQNDIQRETDNIKYLSYNAKLRGSLENGLKNRNALVKEMNDSVEPTFWYFIASDDKIKGIEIYSPYVKQSLGSFLKPLEGKEKRSWFRKNQNNFKTEWSVKDDRIYATRMILDSATSSTVIGYMRLEVFADEFLDGLFQSSYLNNGILLVDANGKKITERTIKDREINKNIYQHIDEPYYEACYLNKGDACFILISYTGETQNCIRMARKLNERNIDFITITSFGTNTLSSLSHCILHVSTREKIRNNLGTFSMNLSTLYLLDLLYSMYFSLNYEENKKKKIEISDEYETFVLSLIRDTTNDLIK